MFKYDQPETPVAHPMASYETPPHHPTSQIADLIRSVWRRKIGIVATGLICACAAVMIGKSLTPRYTATAQLYVDPRELNLVDRELTPRAQDASAMSMMVESQARLISSNNVLLRVIENNNLEQDPEFGGSAPTSMFGSLLRFAGLNPAPTSEEKIATRTAALDTLNKHLNVKRSDRTYVIDIDVWSNDPAKAAKLANAISSAYLNDARDSQSVAARRATSDLSGRLKELQDRLRTAENELAVYKAKNNFVGTQDTLVSDQQLLAGSQRLVAAKALTLDAQARYDQIEISRKTATDAGAIPEALQSPAIANMRAQYAESRRKLAELRTELGPRHPSLRNMEQQVDDIRRNISEEVARYAQSAKNDLARAKDYEASLSKSLDGQKRQSVDLSQAAVKLRELEREVDASRNVYQSFLKRSRETEEQESLNTSSARVIGEATAPRLRTFPPAMSVIAFVGFLAGALGASGLAVAADVLRTAPSQPDRQPEPDLRRLRLSPPVQAAQPDTVVPTVVSTDGPAESAVIAHLTENDVTRTLTSILAPSNAPDLTKLGWPALRASGGDGTFVQAIREMRRAAARQAAPKGALVLAVMGPSDVDERSVVMLNIALAATRDGARVLMIDADLARHALSNKLAGFQAQADLRRGLAGAAKANVAMETINGIAVISASTADAVRQAADEARGSGRYDLVLLDGPVLPLHADDRRLLENADGVIAALSMNHDVNDTTDAIIASLGGSERKIAGAVLNELNATTTQKKAKQYA